MKRIFKRLAQLAAILVLLVIGLLAALHWYQPKLHPVVIPPPKPVSGAAVFYYRAFEAMPEKDEEYRELAKSTVPLDIEKATKLLAKYDTGLGLVAEGTRQDECEWGINLYLWPSPYAHLKKKATAMQLLNIRARLHFANNEVVAATDDLLLLFRFSRHLGQNELTFDHMAMRACNSSVLNLIAKHLQEFDSVSLQRLSDGMTGLSSLPTQRDVLETETKAISIFLRNIIAKGDVKLGTPLLDEQSVIYRVMETFPLVYLWSISRFEQDSEEVGKLMGIPYSKGRLKIDAFVDKLERQKNWNCLRLWSDMILPGIVSEWKSEVRIECVSTILQTALKTQMRDPGAVRSELSKLRDPYDDQPLTLRDVKDGVEIELKSRKGVPPRKFTVALPQK